MCSNGIKKVSCYKFIKYINMLNTLLLAVAKTGHF
jgi:hypothetical protein